MVDDVTMDGRQIKTEFSMDEDSNQLVEVQIGESVNTTLIRKFFEDRMEVIMTVNNVTANSVFRRN